METAGEAVLTVCTQCAPSTIAEDVRSLRAAFDESGIAVAVRGQDCLNCCEAPQALALLAPGRAVHVFHDLTIADDLPDILATVSAWLRAERGWIEDAEACGRLRFCLRARILPS